MSPDEALKVIAAQNAEIAELKQRIAWAEGLRGEGRSRAPGFTPQETIILRMLHARKLVSNTAAPAIQRHVSNIRIKLKTLAPAARIKTVQKEGYTVVAGREAIEALLRDLSPEDVATACNSKVGDYFRSGVSR